MSEPDLLQKLFDENFTRSTRKVLTIIWVCGSIAVSAILTGTIAVVQYIERVDHALVLLQKDVSSVTDLAVHSSRDVFELERDSSSQATRLAVIEALLGKPSK